MWKTKLLFTIFVVAIAILSVGAHNSADGETEDVRFYELKKGNLHVNLTNFGARIVSVNVPNKHGNVADIVLGYDSVLAYQKDKHSFGAIVGRLDKTTDGNGRWGSGAGVSNVIWKVLKHKKSGEVPFITFQYHSHSHEEQKGKLIITATYFLKSKDTLQLTLYSKAKGEEATSMNLAHYTYWNLEGHNSSRNILDHDLHVVASNYTTLDNNLIPTGRILPVEGTPYDFKRFHIIKSRFHKLKNGYEVDYVLDHQPHTKVKAGVELAAVLHNQKSGRVLKVWTDQPLLRFSTGDKLRNVRGKGGVVYHKNAGLVLSAHGHLHSQRIHTFTSLPIITKHKQYNQTTMFQFLVNK